MESTVRVSIIANPEGVIFSSTRRRCSMADPTRKLMKLIYRQNAFLHEVRTEKHSRIVKLRANSSSQFFDPVRVVIQD